MPFYKKKPEIVEALLYSGDNRDEVLEWMGRDYIVGPKQDDVFYIKTMRGTYAVAPGDYVVKGGIFHDYFTLHSEDFHELYQDIDVPA